MGDGREAPWVGLQQTATKMMITTTAIAEHTVIVDREQRRWRSLVWFFNKLRSQKSFWKHHSNVDSSFFLFLNPVLKGMTFTLFIDYSFFSVNILILLLGVVCWFVFGSMMYVGLLFLFGVSVSSGIPGHFSSLAVMTVWMGSWIFFLKKLWYKR